MDSADEIRERGWRQCSVAPRLLAVELNEANVCESGVDDLLIVMTHDCDLVAASFADQPFVEFLIARRLEDSTRNGNLFHGKHPRKMQFELEGRLYGMRIAEIVRIERDVLTKYESRPRLPDSLRGLIPSWLTKRYDRAALPDEFNRRTNAASSLIRKKLRKHGERVTAIFLTLDSENELPVGMTYSVFVTVLAQPEMLDRFAADLTDLTDSIGAELGWVPGIAVIDCLLVSEDEFTFSDIKRSIEWDIWDDLSYRE